MNRHATPGLRLPPAAPMRGARAAVAGLGHVGLYCDDPDRQVEFYTEVLGLQISDQDIERQLYFLSARPDEEHHELLLAGGRNVGVDARVVQQVSFYCASIDDLLSIHERLLASSATIDATVTHGNALSVYYFDPEGNRSEVYWPTGLDARQPFYKRLDFSVGPAVLLEQVAQAVDEFGLTGTDDRIGDPA